MSDRIYHGPVIGGSMGGMELTHDHHKYVRVRLKEPPTLKPIGLGEPDKLTDYTREEYVYCYDNCWRLA